MAHFNRKIRNTVFYDRAMDLTGADMRNCVFDGCVLTLRYPHIILEDSKISNCLLLGAGWLFVPGASDITEENK